MLVALLAALVFAPAASADETLQATFPSRFSATSVTIDQGERFTFQNLDITDHDVTATTRGSDGKALFATPLIGTGEESFVEGSQYLVSGHYDFVCSIHANMQGTLHVTSAGTPVPRPGGGAGGGGGGGVASDKTKPKVRVKLRSARASRVRRVGRLVVEVSVNEAAKVALTAKAKGKTIATGSTELTAAGKRRPELKLTRAGRKLLKRKRRVAVSVRARAIDQAGNSTSAGTRGTLKR